MEGSILAFPIPKSLRVVSANLRCSFQSGPSITNRPCKISNENYLLWLLKRVEILPRKRGFHRSNFHTVWLKVTAEPVWFIIGVIVNVAERKPVSNTRRQRRQRVDAKPFTNHD